LNRRVGSSPRSPSSPGKKRLALHKSLKNDTEMHVPSSQLWKKGNVIIRGAYTGIPLMAVNYETDFQNHWQLQPKLGHGENTIALISEVDPATGRVGRIVGMIRCEGSRSKEQLVLYTYFPAFEGQSVSFLDIDFCSKTMFRYGVVVEGTSGQKHSFARAIGLNKDEYDQMKVVSEHWTPDFVSNPFVRFVSMCKTVSTVDLRDFDGKLHFKRDIDTDITTVSQGQNLLIGVCLSYAMDVMADPP
jgi:hypothetical protein